MTAFMNAAASGHKRFQPWTSTVVDNQFAVKPKLTIINMLQGGLPADHFGGAALTEFDTDFKQSRYFSIAANDI